MQNNKKSPFFSVVITTYNRPHLLPHALKSVIDQTFEDYEIIIINDGSSHDYSEFEKSIANRQFIRYYKTENQGRSQARNFGIAKASGDYICLLDDDDQYELIHLETLHYEIISYHSPVALFHTKPKRVLNGIPIVKKHEFIQGTSDNSTKNNVLKVIYNIEAIHSTAIHNSIFKEERFSDYLTHGEDTDLFVRIAIKYPIISINKVTVIYNLHDNNTSTWSNESALSYYITSLYFYNKYKDVLPYSYISTRIAKFALALAELNKTQTKLAFKYILTCIRFRPKILCSTYIYKLTLHVILLILKK
ncbi:glycosyltransferase family 2 protein [uncultured Pontibacter sp.]|uniref:glycosyltransferase family 2 protein n=1 Tax=uncultured Pontibacter sp. TaxID=453356 RepID=UPI00262A8070|nr:glycosyltransferase family 2 protein [uncultured Pontibacter sp.]